MVHRARPVPGRPSAAALALLLLLAGCDAREPGTGDSSEEPTRASLPAGATIETHYYDPATRTLVESQGPVRDGKRIGDWTFRDQAQNVARRGAYDEEGRETGVWEEFHSNQVRKSRATYVAGELDGPYAEWHRDGAQKLTGSYDAGAREGLFETFYPSGAPESRARYVAGELDGEVVSWYEDGAERERGRYARGAHVGVTEAYHPNGRLKLRADHDEEGRPRGALRTWYADGTEERVRPYDDEGREHGVEYARHENGAVSYVARHEHGSREGPERAWYPDGRLQFEGRYAGGLREGLLRSYHADGSRAMLARFERGKRHGVLRSWYPGGRLQSVGIQLDDERHGLFQNWYESGGRQQLGRFEHGEREGVWLYWGEDFALDEQRSGRYEDDRRVGPLAPEDLALAAELAADTEPRPLGDALDGVPEDAAAGAAAPDAAALALDPWEELLRLEALPPPVPDVPAADAPPAPAGAESDR